VTLSVRVITRVGSRRVAKAAFELARQRRRHLTYVHKDTVFKLSCGMFVEECKKLAAEYPEVRVDDVIVDTFAMRLVRDPQSFDVVVTTNMFGDILSDEAAGLVGGLGMAPGLCIGDGDVAMAQATHGSAPDIAGRGIANPYAMIESARMMFDWLGHSRGNDSAVRMAASISRATTQALADREARPGDIRGNGNTATFTEAVVRHLHRV
jgi:3-isopropylmalate dehydrogenase